MKLVVTWDDVRGFRQFEKQIQRLQSEYPKALPRMMNQVGRRARTKVIRALAQQTGLNQAVIRRAVDEKAAGAGGLTYELRTRGGNIRLKYLRPKETADGVVAHPFGKRTLYPQTFMRGGWWPDRVDVPDWNGHVMFRNRSKGRHFTFARSGVYIPTEMVEGQTKAAWQAEVNTILPLRLNALIRKLLA